MVSILASRSSRPRVDSHLSQKNFTGNKCHLAEVFEWCGLKEIGQCLENVDQTHLVLASGKLVLQKN